MKLVKDGVGRRPAKRPGLPWQQGLVHGARCVWLWAFASALMSLDRRLPQTWRRKGAVITSIDATWLPTLQPLPCPRIGILFLYIDLCMCLFLPRTQDRVKSCHGATQKGIDIDNPSIGHASS